MDPVRSASQFPSVEQISQGSTTRETSHEEGYSIDDGIA